MSQKRENLKSIYLFIPVLFLFQILSQLQDWNMECKDLESRRKIGEFENGNAEE